MRDLRDIISRCLLPRVRAPGQYVGLEANARCGDLDAADVRVVLAFPDTYAIGISHLGSQILYSILNGMPGVACDRTYCPQLDAEQIMRNEGVRLFSWERRAAVADFDMLGFSLGYEMCATNVLTMLDLAGVPLATEQRTDSDPIVVAGDALADSPEPMADFIDVFLAGDGEVNLPAFVELLRQMKAGGAAREDVLLAAARQIPSAYVPRFYQPLYDAAGRYAGLQRLRDDVPQVIQHAHLQNMSDNPALTTPLVPLSEAVHERVMIEIMRGCPNACRFCQAGATRLPVRYRSVDEVMQAAREALAATGYREISLLSLSTSDYPHLDELIDRLNAEFAPQHVSISLPSLRVDSQLQQLPRLTSTVRKGGLTIAAEAASLRLRRAIDKDITDEHMLEGVQAAYRAGYRSVKVYFMVGLPGEQDADVDEIVALCRRLSDARRAVDGQRGAISASVSWFVPKPHTPMQWSAMRSAEYFLDVRRRLKDLARRTPITMRFHRVERSVLEAVLCRGDRRVGAAILAAWQAGARLDTWDEHFDFGLWASAFEQTGIDPAFYAHREMDVDEPLPWGHVQCFRTEKFLRQQQQRMLEELEATD